MVIWTCKYHLQQPQISKNILVCFFALSKIKVNCEAYLGCLFRSRLFLHWRAVLNSYNGTLPSVLVKVAFVPHIIQSFLP